MQTRRIYFDHNATAPMESAVVDAMLPYLLENFGNASSIHSFGQRARGAVERARESVAALIGARPSEIIFTSGGTESDNAAIFGLVAGLAAQPLLAVRSAAPEPSIPREPSVPRGPFIPPEPSVPPEPHMPPEPSLPPEPSEPRRASSSAAPSAGVFAPKGLPHIITTTIEHHAVLHACEALAHAVNAVEREAPVSGAHAVKEVAVTYVPVNTAGVVAVEDIRRALRPETVLISVMHANNELGTLQPIAEIARVAAAAGVFFHTDAVQSAGKILIDVKQLGVDLLSLSAHKFGGPQGVGALYVRAGLPLKPLLHGGPNERGRRAGTENVLGIVGLGKAAEIARTRLAENVRRVAALRDRLERGLLDRIPGARINGAQRRTDVHDEQRKDEERPNEERPNEERRFADGSKVPEGRGSSGHGFSRAEKPSASGVLTPEAVLPRLEQPPQGGAEENPARVPNTTNILFPGVDSESLVIALDLQGLACSAGAACSSGTVTPSHVLTAIGLTDDEARASVRFSLGPSNTEEEIDRALELIPAAVERNRRSAVGMEWRPQDGSRQRAASAAP